MKTFAFVTLALSLFACGGDDSSSNKPSCEAIVNACHEVDPGSGPIHECHENAESVTATEASCAAAKEACLSLCSGPQADAGPGADAAPQPDAQQ